MKQTKSSQQTTMPALTRSKRYLYRLCIVVITLAICEITSLLVVWFREGESLVGQSWINRQSRLIELYSSDLKVEAAPKPIDHGLREQTGRKRDVVHPYLGFVGDPTKTRFANDLGFRGTYPLQQRADDKFIVAILGGSVAEGFAADGMPTVAQELAKLPQLEGKEIVTVNLASGGYKQPQQLMTLSLMLTLGGQFDAVINLDGFNEVALDEGANAATATFPAYPYFWNAMVRPATDPESRRLLGQREYVKSQLVALAKQGMGSPIWKSVSYRAFLTMRQEFLIRRLKRTELSIRDQLATIDRGDAYFMTGPEFDRASENRLHLLASVWKQCSLQLDRLCRGNGIRYFHFLQPNQYVPESKPLGPAEHALAFNEESIYKSGVENGYRLLADHGKELTAAGVTFVDLRMAFENIEEPVYIDDCCHLDLNGNEIIASIVAQAMIEDFHSVSRQREGE